MDTKPEEPIADERTKEMFERYMREREAMKPIGLTAGQIIGNIAAGMAVLGGLAPADQGKSKH